MINDVFALTAQGRRLLDRALKDGEELVVPTLTEAHFRPVATRDLDLSQLQSAAAVLVRPHQPGSPSMDSALAPVLHSNLRLGRRLASDPDVWGWLGADPLRPLMEKRWPLRADKRRWERYLGSAYEHGLGRLWWAAELTAQADGDRYAETERLVQWQYLADRVLRNQLSRSQHVLFGVLDVLAGETYYEIISGTMKALGTTATTVCLEALTREEVAELVRDLRFGLPAEVLEKSKQQRIRNQ